MVDVVDVGIVFVGVDRPHLADAYSLIEGVMEARTTVSVVAIGDGQDSELVLAAMRAGAKDFLSPGQRSSEVHGLIWRVGRKHPSALAGGSKRGQLVALYGVDTSPDSTLVSSHLALKLADEGASVLFVDMGPAIGEAEAILSLKCTFGLEDAMRAARRLDSTVIESAFSVHSSGLGLLPLLESSRYPESYSYAETILLLGALRQYFSCVIVNACGQEDSDFIRALVDGADQVLWYIDQSVSCSRRNLARLHHWRSESINLQTARLVVDRYQPRQAPAAMDLSEMFEMPLAAALSSSIEQRLGCRNQGLSLYKLAPRDELTRGLKSLADGLPLQTQPERENKGFLKRLFHLDS